jgi:hypothetical protein
VADWARPITWSHATTSGCVPVETAETGGECDEPEKHAADTAPTAAAAPIMSSFDPISELYAAPEARNGLVT